MLLSYDSADLNNWVSVNWDDSTAAANKSWDFGSLPGGRTYVMLGRFGPMDNGADVIVDSVTVTPDMLTNGEYTWWWH